MTQIASLPGPRTSTRLARAALWFLLVVALIGGIATLLAGIVALVTSLSAGNIHLTLIADKGLPRGWSADATFHIVGGAIPSAALTLQGMSPGVVAFAVVSAIALLLTQVALCALVAVLAWRLLHDRLFRRSVWVTVTAAGFVLAIGGLLSQVGNAFGGSLAASELNGGGHGFWPLAGRFDPTLMIFGFVLLLVGLAFKSGGRLQRDTEGLI